jgi:dihydrofolate reductase
MTQSDGRLIAQQWVSLDGYASGEENEEVIFAAVTDFGPSETHNVSLLEDVDAVLLGRKSYEVFSAYWPTATDEAMATIVNSLPKLVASRSLEAAPWGEFEPAEIVTDAVQEVRRRMAGGEVILVWGSLALMHELMDADLVSELDLFIAPVALGGGTELIPPDKALSLRQVEADAWRGSLHGRYIVERGDVST